MKTTDILYSFRVILNLRKKKILNQRFFRLTDQDVLQVLIKMQKEVFHPLNIWYVRTLEAAFDAATQMELLPEALAYGKDLAKGYE